MKTPIFRRTSFSLFFLSALLAANALTALPAAADKYPSKPLTIIVPFKPGGSVDRLARGLSTFLTYELGQPIIVRNKPGAGGKLGHTYFLKRPPDGYTLLVTPATPYLASNIYITNAKFKISNFAFINAQWVDYTMVAVPKSKPYKTLGDLIRAIKKNPGKLSTAVTFGSSGHMSTMALLKALKLPAKQIRIVTYGGGGPLRTAVAGGHVDFAVLQAQGSEVIRPLIRPLAVFLKKKRKDWDAPPINEALKPFGVKVPLISGSVRVIAASMAFKKKYPGRWKTLVKAYKKTLKSKAFRRWLKRSQIGRSWYGPEKTTEIVKANFEALKEYKDLLKKRAALRKKRKKRKKK